MRAWQFESSDEGLVLNEVAEPVAGPGEVVVEVRGSGLCHSDLTYMKNPAALHHTPITEGHEIAGVIIELGDGVTDWAIGDRVGVCPSGTAAPAGVFRDGGFADRHVCPAADLARVPDGLSWALAAAATDAGMTAYHAVLKRGGAREGQKVGIIGFGGLGQIATRAAVLVGAEVHVCEPKEAVWEIARSVGAASTVADAQEWAGAQFDVIVDFAGYGTTDKALTALKRRAGGLGEAGRLVQVGLGTGSAEFSIHNVLGRDIVGSMGGTVADIEEIYDLMVRGELAPVVTEIGFEDIRDGLEQLRAGAVTGRLVATWGE